MTHFVLSTLLSFAGVAAALAVLLAAGALIAFWFAAERSEPVSTTAQKSLIDLAFSSISSSFRTSPIISFSAICRAIFAFYKIKSIRQNTFQHGRHGLRHPACNSPKHKQHGRFRGHLIGRFAFEAECTSHKTPVNSTRKKWPFTTPSPA